MPNVCPLCVATKGLRGKEVFDGTCDYAFNDDEEFAKHMESEHHIPVQRPNETDEGCKERFFKQNPTAKDPKTCQCPQCKAKRTGDDRELLVYALRMSNG